jgi:hypothetical protein
VLTGTERDRQGRRWWQVRRSVTVPPVASSVIPRARLPSKTCPNRILFCRCSCRRFSHEQRTAGGRRICSAQGSVFSLMLNLKLHGFFRQGNHAARAYSSCRAWLARGNEFASLPFYSPLDSWNCRQFGLHVPRPSGFTSDNRQVCCRGNRTGASCCECSG